MLRTALLGGNAINLDADYSKYIETVSEAGVIEGFQVQNHQVLPGKARVKTTRSNGETIFALVQSNENIPISLSGDAFIFLEISQSAIDNGQMNNEDGTGIASIKVGPQKPNQNYLLLAVWQNGRLTDARQLIPKLQSLSSRTSSLEEKVKTSETKITKLEDKGTPQYLGKFVEVGEAYQAGDVMVERGGKLIQRFGNLTVPDIINASSRDTKSVGPYTPEQGEDYFVEIDKVECTTSAEHETTPELRFYTGSESHKAFCKYTIYKGITKNIKIPLAKYPGGAFSIASSHNGSFTTTKITGIRIRSRRAGAEPLLYPREVKGVGERVECTIMGLHSNGELIHPKPVEIVIGKEMSGTFTTSREAPSNGYLEITYKTGYDEDSRGGIRIGGISLSPSRGEKRERVFVEQGIITMKSWYNSSSQAVGMLRLEKFTSVM